MSRVGVKAHDFPMASRREPGNGAFYTVQTIRCAHSGCSVSDEVRRSGNNLTPVALVAEKFRRLGWDVGTRRSHDLCPEHSKLAGAARRQAKVAYVAPPKPSPPPAPPPTLAVMAEKLADLGKVTMTPVVSKPLPALAPKSIKTRLDAGIPRGPKGTRRMTGFPKKWNAQNSARKAGYTDDQFQIINEPGGTFGWAPITKETPMTAIVTPIAPAARPTPAAPPREFTRDERRKALDGLESAYDADNGRYRGTMTDKELGVKLDLPWALIKEVREQFFGPEQNEAALQMRRDLAALRDDAMKMAERHLSLASDAEALANRANTLMGAA